MKKILIVVPSFAIGGTIVSLHSLLSFIGRDQYSIDIFALNRKGEYLDRMPNSVILPENVWLSHTINEENRYKRLINGSLRIVRAACRKLGMSIEPLLCRLADRKINFQQYDAVINYSESIANIVCSYPAKRRITWVHCDYERYLTLVNRDESKIYEAFDTVVCVSEFAKSVFCKCMPHMKDKTVVIHNIINTKDILEKAKEPIDDDNFKTDGYTIVSVGRLDPVKQFHLIPSLAAEIKKQTNKKFVWYIIGGDRGFESYVNGIKQDIVKLGVTEEVVMLGEKSNVYPHMVKADLYVSTSMSESFSLVINEAKALGVPIVCNNFGCASESITHGIDGFIVSVDDIQFKDIIVSLIEEEVSLPIMKNNGYSTDFIIKKINNIL